MSSQFKNISIEEMTAFLMPKGFQVISVPGTKETVFGKRMPHNLPLTLRIYTGIENGVSRGVGEDAIRCTLFWRNSQGEVKKVSGDKRVHRVTNWKANLQNRLDNWNQDFIMCSCGAPMIERKGKNGVFLGCCNYPVCRNTRQVKNQEAERFAYKNTPIAPVYPMDLDDGEMAAEMEVLRLEQQYS